jgi:predicted helicase
LLAYYIAAINIEQVYHSIVGGDYIPFDGICLTDTFSLYEKGDFISQLAETNKKRLNRQKNLDIRVIFGNPPYSTGQKIHNDNNQNLEYLGLEERIAKTYLKDAGKGGKKSLYDTYVKAISWATERVGKSGVIGYISGNGFIEKPAMEGMRRCLQNDFSSIYVLNLKGDIRKNMLSKGKAKEGQNIFGSGSMTGIAITLFVKNENANGPCNIFYRDIGEDLSTSDKLEELKSFTSAKNILKDLEWGKLIPDEYGDWINQRNSSFDNYIILGSKQDNASIKMFGLYSTGVVTNRDAWCYNFSKNKLAENIRSTIDFYSEEMARYQSASEGAEKKDRIDVNSFLSNDATRISWSLGVKNALVSGRKKTYDEKSLIKSLYRPFTKQWMYFSRELNEIVGQMPKVFPTSDTKNLLICVSGIGSRSGFSTLITDSLPNLDVLEKAQCFPLYYFDENLEKNSVGIEKTLDLFSDLGEHSKSGLISLTDASLKEYKLFYKNNDIEKEDIFYYIYGILHSEGYREKFQENLIKEMPRIPLVKSFKDFLSFSEAGKQLANLHLNYEYIDPYPVQIVSAKSNLMPEDYRVAKMRIENSGGQKDLTKVIYNDLITISGIPSEAYDYVVGGRPALDWVLERQVIKQDKDS